MVALLTATTGVSVQQLYCHCLGKTTTSLLAMNASMPVRPGEPTACCQKKVSKKPACCAKTVLAAKKAQGCTKKTTQVFQLKTEFLVDHPTEKSFDFPLWINDFPMLRRMARPVICEASIFHLALPPPPTSGRDVCLRHQLALC